MYRNSYQRGMLTVLFSVGSKPLGLWGIKTTPDGYITRFLDQDIKSMVVELGATNVSTTYIYCPKSIKVSLGISMPFLVMVVKNLRKYFSFEITILDDTGTRRRFRASNFQSTTQITPMCTVIPIGLSDGWNQIQFNLADFTRRAYNKQFVEVQRLKINANIRIRRVYFTERLLPEEELPPEYKLFFPLKSKKEKAIKEKEQKEGAEPSTEVIKESSKVEMSLEDIVAEHEEKVKDDAITAVDEVIEVLVELVHTKTKDGEGMVTPASETATSGPIVEAQIPEQTEEQQKEVVEDEDAQAEEVKSEKVTTEEVPEPEIVEPEVAGEMAPTEEITGEATALEENKEVEIGAGEATLETTVAETKEEVPAEEAATEEATESKPEPEPEAVPETVAEDEAKTEQVVEKTSKTSNVA